MFLLINCRNLLIAIVLAYSVDGRIHNLTLEEDGRREITLSTFGFLKAGTLDVIVHMFSYQMINPADVVEDGRFGFTISKRDNTGGNTYLNNIKKTCKLDGPSMFGSDSDQEKDKINVALVTLNFSSKQLEIQRFGEIMKDVQFILPNEKTKTVNSTSSKQKRSADIFGKKVDNMIKPVRQRREVKDNDIPIHDDAGKATTKLTKSNDVKITTKTDDSQPPKTADSNPLKTDDSQPPKTADSNPPKTDDSQPPKTADSNPPKTDDSQPPKTADSNPPKTADSNPPKTDDSQPPKTADSNPPKTDDSNPPKTADSNPPKTDDSNPPKTADRNPPANTNPTLPMHEENGNGENRKYSFKFRMTVLRDVEEGLYHLYFHNCLGATHQENRAFPTIFNLSIEIIENNNDNYLSAGNMPLPNLYFILCCVFFGLGCIWFTVLRKSREDVYKIHYLMLTVVCLKFLSLLFHGIHYHFIKITGTQEEAWAVLYYIAYLMKVTLLFLTILLIGAGWAFVKHLLSEKEKKLFIIFIPLQILANVAFIIVEESEEGMAVYTTWKEIFIMVDLLCCGAILFPVVWSIRHLTDASHTDGKAAINLNKLKLFRQFYILVVCYIYFTRIIVYLLQITVPFKYEWLDELFKQVAILIFFVVTGVKFRPASDNPYLQVPTDSDDEMEMDEVLTKSEALSTVVKVNRDSSDRETTTANKRESSHEYD